MTFTLGSAGMVTTSLPPLTRNLSLGTTGSDVTELQTFLQGQGYLTATPTGYFGNLTKAAVEKFQQANQIAPVSGLVGPLTRAKVNALLGTATNPAPPATTTSTSTQASPQAPSLWVQKVPKSPSCRSSSRPRAISPSPPRVTSAS